MIKITIVTVTYNALKPLLPTVESVIGQTYRNIEHLIIDGASTDRTDEFAREYARISDKADRGHTVKVVSEPDKGIYDAMNKGLQLATGDYVVFLNAGDRLSNDCTIEWVVRCGRFEETPPEKWPAVIYGDTDIFDDEGRFLRKRRLSPPLQLTWLSFMRGMLVCHQAFYARTDIARATPYDLRYRFSADVDWCIRIMREARRRRLPLTNAYVTLAGYCEEGMTTRNHRASLRERFNVMSRHYGLLPTLVMHCWFVVRAVVKR